MWLLLVGLSFYSLKVSCQHVLDVGNWTNAKQSCKLATPNITFSKTAITLELGLDMLEKGQKAWIGYTKTSEIFEYIECVRVNDITSSKYETRRTAHDPGQCSSACKHSNFFGIRTRSGSSACFCFETDAGDVKYTRDGCDTVCDNTLFSCGSRHYMSLYTSVQIPKEMTDADKCLAYTSPGRTYDWKDCKDNHYAACFRGVHDTSLRMRYNPTYWGEAIDYCFHRDNYPISNQNTLYLLKDKSYWTAYINALIISGSEEVVPSEVYKYGYIERLGDVLYLRFTKDTKEEMIAICQTEPTSSTVTATTNKQTTEFNTKPTNASNETNHLQNTKPNATGDDKKPTSSTVTALTNKQTTELTTKSTNASNETNHLPHTKPNATGDDKTIVYVAVPLVIIVCASVAVVVVCCYRKKRSLQPKEADIKAILPISNLSYNNLEDEVCYMNTIEHAGGLSTASEHNTHISKELQHAKIDPKLDIQSHSTDIGDAVEIYEKVDEVPALFSMADTADVISSEQTTTPRENHTYNHTANYNRDVDNYDHIGAAKSMTMNEDGHYNTTCSDDKGESFYDTTNSSGPRHAVNDETYDMTNCPNDYAMANGTCRKKDNYINVNCTDIYSFAGEDDQLTNEKDDL